jgi:uncharacterized membrane protein
MTQSRWKSKYLWAAIIALVAFVLGNWGLYNAIGLTDESFKQFADLIFMVLVGLGIYNNPTDAENW